MEGTTTGELVHQVEVASDGFDHRAECSCGWASEWVADDVAAVLAGVEHPEIAVGPTDPLDRLVSGLLDVQDDLAQAVVWLAENWSADLPVPALPGSERCRVELKLQCRDADELRRLAYVLGTDVEVDSCYDTDEAIYRCARRSFGTVVVEAWRYER